MIISKKIPIGVDNFSELVSSSYNYLFVDKSLFIKELLDSGVKLSLIIRPRRWGKTLNMSMLQHFFSNIVSGIVTNGLFDNLKIAQEQNGYYLEQYQGKYPVIFVSFKNIKEKNYSNFIDRIAFIVKSVCNDFPELNNSDKLTDLDRDDLEKLKGINKNNKANEIELQEFLKTISNLLYKHYNQKVIILIDEYDTPLNAAYDQPYFEELVDFLKNMFGSALKGNNALAFGVMTGILRLSKNKMLSDLNNLKLYSLSEEQYSNYFGFTESEILNLLQQNNINLNNIEQLNYWYNGYKAGNLESVYNPWSILNFFADKGRLKSYWIKTGDEKLLKRVLLNSGEKVKIGLNQLIVGDTIDSVLDEYLSFDQIKEGNDEVVWSLLWCMGYLKSVGEPKLAGTLYRHKLKIPNYEVECSYRDVFTSFIRSFNEIKYDICLNSLVQGNVEGFVQELENFMLTIPSYYDLANETNYHMLLLAWSFSLNETHNIYSNKESGLGRPDLVLIPYSSDNNLAIIIEFKKAEINKDIDFYKNLAIQGINQINNKQYDIVIQNNASVTKILKLCLVFYGKQFAYEYVID